MANVVVQLLTTPFAVGDVEYAPAALFAPLSSFVVPLADIRPGSEGFPLLNGGELARFLESGQPRGAGRVASVTAAIPSDSDHWIFVPEDDDQSAPGTFQLFDFIKGVAGTLFVPTVVDVALPPPEGLAAFIDAGIQSRLWRGRRHRKEGVVCVDTDAGTCEGDDCEAGCAKVVWGDPGSPRWACDCPST